MLQPIGVAAILAGAWWAPGTLAAECGGGADFATATSTVCAEHLITSGGPEAELYMLVLRAGEHRRAKDFGQARSDIEQALAIDANNVNALLELGRVERDEGDEQRSLATFERVSQSDPSKWRAVLNRMDLLANLGRPEECLALSGKAHELAPDQGHTYAYLGRCQSDLGRHDEALANLEEARELGLEQAFLYSNLSLEYLAAGQKEEALAAAEHAVTLDPSHEHSQASLLEALLELGRFEDAINAHAAARIAVDPDEKIGISNDLAWGLYLAGEYESALSVIQGYFADDRVLTADSYYEADTYAHILSALDREDEAVEQFFRAVELRGKDQDIFYRDKLVAMGIEVGDGPEGLKSALQLCVERGAECRLE